MQNALPSSRPWASDVAGGLVTGAVAIVYAVSYAALMFPGKLAHMLPMGIGLCLVSAVLGAFWMAWRSALPFAVAGPDGYVSSILAGMAASVAFGGAAATSPAAVLVLLALTTLLFALLLLALGVGRLGSAVRYVPFPVVGGFVASTGWLIAVGSLRVGGMPDVSGGLGALLDALRHPQALATVALGALFVAGMRRFKHPATSPLLVVAATVVTLGLLAAGPGLEQARAQGWLFESARQPQWQAPWQLAFSLDADAWRLIAAQWMEMLAVSAVSVITVLLGASATEVMTRSDISLNAELRNHGWMNLVASALGGCICVVSVGRSKVLLDSGARTRAAGMVAAAVCAAGLAGATLALGMFPKPVLGGFLLSLGAGILWEWVVESRARVARPDWALIVIILAVTALIGFSIAVLVGVIASCLNFALSYSRVGVVQHDLDGTALRSAVVRPAEHRRILDSAGTGIRVLVLRGMVFFGTANALLERLRPFLEQGGGPTTRALVLDFTHVASADSSAAMTFTKIARLARAYGVRVLVCGLSPATQAAAGQDGAAGPDARFATLDEGLAAAEEALLHSHGQDTAAAHAPLDGWLARELGDAHWAALRPHLVRRELEAGAVLLRQGDASDATLYLIESGRLLITLAWQGQQRRLASLMAGNIVGEMALYSPADRSASVMAEEATVVWALDHAHLEELHRESPLAGMQVHALVMRTMAERVRQANATIAALQRGA